MSDNFDFRENNEVFEGAEEIFAPLEPFTPILTPEETEKKEIKKTGRLVGLCFIILYVISFVSALILSFLPNGEDPAVSQAFQIGFSILVFTLPFIITFKGAGFRISDLVSFKKTEKGLALPLFFFGLAFCSFCNIASSYMDSLFSAFGIDYSIEAFKVPEGIFGFILCFLSVAVVPALVEEFAFRGIVLGSLRKYGDGFALVASSVCFSVMHGNFDQIPFAFAVGLFLGFTLLKTGSLRVAILLHFINNLVPVLFSYMPSTLSMEIQNIIYILYMLITFVLGMVFLTRTKTEFFSIQTTETALGEKAKYKSFFLNGAIIAFIIIKLVESILLLII